jgi:hypothetical protein
VAQEDAALVAEGFEFEGPCSLMVSVNESYAVVLEGQEEGEAQYERMGIYECVVGKEVCGRGVWQAVGGIDRFLSYCSSSQAWTVANRESMEAGSKKSVVFVRSTATTPDQVTEQWMASNNDGWVNAPKLGVRVCSSVEKHAADQRVEQEQQQGMEQANQSRRLVVEGLVNDRSRLMGFMH